MKLRNWFRSALNDRSFLPARAAAKRRQRGRPQLSVTPLLEPLENRTVPAGLNLEVGEITGVPTTSVLVNSPITTFSATFVDLNAGDTHTAYWDWSDGTISPGIVIENNGAGTVTGSHTYLTAKECSAELIVTSSSGDEARSYSARFFVYDPNGTPPTPFISGLTGKVLQDEYDFDHGPVPSYARAIAEDPTTGNLIELTDVLYPTGGPSEGLRINRFLPNGMRDLSFGNGAGWVPFDNAITASQFGLAVDSAGGILIAGSVDGGVTGMDFAVARYHPDGVLDTSFGNGGVARADVGSQEDWGEGLTLDDQGRILVIGSKTNSVDGTHDAALVRWTAAGAPDASFGNNGTVVYDTGGDEIAASLAADPTTDDLVATIRVDGSLHLIRFDSAGNGEDVLFDNVVNAGAASGVAVDESGRILLAGYQGPDFAVVRYDEEGALDLSFGDNGVATIHVGPPNSFSNDVAQGISLDSQGRILLAGSAWYYNWWLDLDMARPALARLTSTGAPDRSFGDAGGPAPAVGFIGEPAFYKGAVVDFGDTWDFPFTYEWSAAASNGDITASLSGSLGNNHSLVIPGFSFVPTLGGTYTVTLALTGPGGVRGAVSVITTVASGNSDFDNDGIDNVIDIVPASFSNDFSDGSTSGTIEARGDQILTVIDAPNSGDGVIISAAASGGSAPAIINIDGGASRLYIGPGDEVKVTHGSVIVHVLAGTVEATFVGDSGEVATASLSAGNELTFKPDTFVFSAPATNTETVQVVVNGSAIEIGSGQAVRSVHIDITPGSASNTLNLASNGVISVAILSTASFDARTVNVASLLFAGAHAVQSSFKDVNGDGIRDLVVNVRTQDTTLRSLYEHLVADDINEDGVLDSNHELARVSLTGLCQDGTALIGADVLDLFLSGKALRDMLAALAAAGAI
jgi:uncharacterized delta-60 repeat protein